MLPVEVRYTDKISRNQETLYVKIVANKVEDAAQQSAIINYTWNTYNKAISLTWNTYICFGFTEGV